MSRVFELGDKFAHTVRAESAADNHTLFIASTPSEDRAGDIVRQDWRLSEFRANPVILWAHNASIPPVGRAVDAKTSKQDGVLHLRVEWDDSPANPLGRTVASQYERGFLSTGSVGFRSDKKTLRTKLDKEHPAYQQLAAGVPEWQAGYYFERNTLLEFSAVAIPMNPEAVAIRSWATESGDHLEQLARYLGETTTRSLRAELLELVRGDQGLRTALRAILLTTEEISSPAKSADDLGHLFNNEADGLSHLWSP